MLDEIPKENDLILTTTKIKKDYEWKRKYSFVFLLYCV